MLEARLADCPVKGVLLDLAAGEEGHEGETAFAMLKRLKGRLTTEGTEGTEEGGEERERGSGGAGEIGRGDGKVGEVGSGSTHISRLASHGSIRVIVFGPHVQAEQLAAAKRMGADVVMARGALAANLPRVLRELEGGGEGLRDQMVD